METNHTHKFNRKATLIGHDVSRQNLLFNYTGATPTLLGTYYLVHHTELNDFRTEIENLLYVVQEMQQIIELQDDLIEKGRMYIKTLEKDLLKL